MHINCLFAALVAGMSFSFATPALAQLPSGATVRAGGVSFAAPAANQAVINQSSAKAIIDWRTFSIGAGNSVQFVQPNASAIALNRVTGSQASLLQGALSANGQVWLLNPNGVFIGAGGQINSAGFLGTTRALSDSDFLAGRYRFTDPVIPGAAVINLGTITATNGGYAVLAGEQVRNEGLIQANLGSVVLGGAKTFVMDVVGDKLLSFQVTGAVEIAPSTPAALVDNSGRLIADGGQVLISARALKGVIDSVINTTGLVQATSTRLVNGVVTLDAGGTGQLVNTGLVTANNADGTGGLIQALAGSIVNTGTLSADGGGANGSGGVIRLDAGERIEHAGSILANASNEGVGQGGSVILMASLNNPKSTLAFTGSLAAQGGLLGGDGGFIETSASQVNIGEAARVSTAAAKGLTGNWLIDPNDFTISAGGGNITGILLGNQLATSGVTISTATQGTAGGSGDILILDAISWASNNTLTLSAGRNIAINQSISATGSSGRLALEFGQLLPATGNLAFFSVTAPVNLRAGGNFSTKLGSNGSTNGFTVITALGAAGSTTATDLQGIGGVLSGSYVLGANIDASATSSWNGGAGFLPIGGPDFTGFTGTFDGLGHSINGLTINRPTTRFVGLFGRLSGTVRNIGLDGARISGGNDTGGLAGNSERGISNSYVNGSVSGDTGVGGLIGTSGSFSTMSNSYSTGSVTGNSYVGGLVGLNNGVIRYSHAIGNGTGNSYVGGLAGINYGTISNSYAIGSVTGNTNAGGLAGLNNGLIENSYATDPYASVILPTITTAATATTVATVAVAAVAAVATVATPSPVPSFYLPPSMSGLIGGQTGGLMSGLMSGPIVGPIVGPMGDLVMMVTGGSAVGPTGAPMSGPIGDLGTMVTGGSTIGPMGDLGMVVTGGSTVGPLSGPMAPGIAAAPMALGMMAAPMAAGAMAPGIVTAPTAPGLAVGPRAPATGPLAAAPGPTVAAPPSTVMAPPPSPVAAVKAQTPRDLADAGDKTLAAVAPPNPVKPAPQQQRAPAVRSVVSFGMVSVQLPSAARLPPAAATGQRYSLSGNRSAW